MNITVGSILATVAALPGVYGIVCWIRLEFNARNAARWIRRKYKEEWNRLNWIVKRNPRAAVEALITKGLISEAEAEEYHVHDNYLEMATWIGLLITALLLLAILAVQLVASTIG